MRRHAQKRKWNCSGWTEHFLSRFQKCVHSILKTFILLSPGCQQSAIFISNDTVFILGFWYDGSILHLIKMTGLFSVWKYWRSKDRQLSTGPLLPRDCFFSSSACKRMDSDGKRTARGGEAISRGRGTIMDNLPASTLSGYFRRSHHVALKAVFYCTVCRAWGLCNNMLL